MTRSLPPYEVHWHPATSAPTPAGRGPFTTHYPVPLIDGSVLELPLRTLPGDEQAIALLMSNQTPFTIEDRLVGLMSAQARALAPQMVVAVPTMGLDYARRVARDLGLPHYAAMGLSRKFWYDEALSEPVVSSTSPDQHKRLYLDPALLDRVAGQEVVLVDDVINTGASALAAVRLLQRAGARVAGLVVALTEGQAWRQTLTGLGANWPDRVHAVGHIPLFEAHDGGGWRARPD